MGECAFHQACDVGVCTTCLQKKLTHVWRGEEGTTMPSTEASDPALTRKPHPSFDAESSAAPDGVMKDGSALRSGSRKKKKKKSVTIIADESLTRTGLPLVDRIAKEIALRVIKEVGDDAISVESENHNVWEVEDHKRRAETKESHWHSKIIRPKLWVKGLGSNKVFPSKSENQSSPSRLKKSRKEERRKFVALGLEVELPTVVIPVVKVVTSETVIEGMPDEILKPEDMNQRLRTSYNTVLSWLRDLPSPQTHLLPQLDEEVPEDELVVPAALSHDPGRNDDVHDEDLTLVGHLHEIAEEEHEINSSEEPEAQSITNHLSQVSSFGKFLIRAAQRQPRAGLSRVAIATQLQESHDQKLYYSVLSSANRKL